MAQNKAAESDGKKIVFSGKFYFPWLLRYLDASIACSLWGISLIFVYSSVSFELSFCDLYRGICG